MIHQFIKSQIHPLKAKLSRDIAFKIFLCFVIIEIIILLPSYQGKRQELTTESESIGLATIKPLVQIQDLTLDSTQFDKIGQTIIDETSVLGLRIYQKNGKPLTQIGNMSGIHLPDIASQNRIRQWSANGHRYFFSLHPSDLDADFIVIAQLDTSHIKPELAGYVQRIIGLIILIGLIVTISTMFVLEPTVLRPILRLRSDLIKVGEAIKQQQPKPEVHHQASQFDELSEVIHTFSKMVDQIYQAIHARDQAEQKLQTINTQLNQEIDKRTVIEDRLHETNEALQALVISDGLTQVANRRHFDTVLEQEWRRMKREQHPLSLIMLDVDCFKSYNDTYGHQAGDRCLIKIAQALSESIMRPADLVARYGGEEFAVVLPNTDLQGAIVIAQKIQTSIEKQKIVHTSSTACKFVTASMGITCQVPSAHLSITALIGDADTALYQAKRRGRNQYYCETRNPNRPAPLETLITQRKIINSH